jgi:NADH:ubiquinone reductase (H+-translocating)
MMSAYFVIPLVFGIVLSYLWIIHRFWLRHVFREDHKPTVQTRIVILGGGFGGWYSALHFEKTIAADPSIEVTLVSRENFVLFTPMLHEVAAGDLDPSDIVSPLRQMLKRVRFLQAEVDHIDVEARHLTLACGIHRERRVLTYDYLIIALGSESNYFNLPGVGERALTMKSLGDAFILRNHALGMLESASLTDDPSAQRAMLTFVVAGGGFAGVETVGALNDFVREAIAYYPALAEAEPRLVLVHPTSVILPELNESLGRYAQAELASRKVEIRTDARVTAFSDEGVELSNSETLPTHTLVWTAGVKPPAVLQTLPIKKEKGRIAVNEMLEVPGCPGVWAVGDCASIPNASTGKPHPPTAQHALREAVCCAKNVVAAIRGCQPEPFRFRTLGQLASIGHHAGVAEILGLRLSGFPAWFLWRTIYLAKLPTFEKKLRVAVRWTLDFAFPRDLTQHVTLQGIDRVSQLLAYVRQHPMIPPAVASDSPSALRSSPHAKRTAILEL